MILPNIWENKKCSKPPTSLDSQVVLPFLSSAWHLRNPILSLCLGVNGSNRKCVTLEKRDPTSKLHMVEELQVIHPVKTLDLLEADQHAMVASSRRKRLASEHPACVKSCGLPEIATQKNFNSLSILYDSPLFLSSNMFSPMFPASILMPIFTRVNRSATLCSPCTRNKSFPRQKRKKQLCARRKTALGTVGCTSFL